MGRLDPQLVHYLDQLQGAMRETGAAIGAFHEELTKAGVPPERADPLLRRLEDLLLGPLFDQGEEMLRREHDDPEDPDH